MKTVTLSSAFVFTCDECGRNTFVNGIELDQENMPEEFDLGEEASAATNDTPSGR